MKNSFKIGLLGLTITCMVYTSCKKTDVQPINQSEKNQADQKAAAGIIANNFLNAFSYQSKSSLKTNGNRLGVMSAPQCGDFIITPTNQTFMRGDTSFHLKGNSIFTFTCSPGSSGPDSYTFADTLYTTESAKGFANTFENFQKYKVASNPNGNTYNLIGNMEAWARFALVGDNGITEHHDFSTKYELDGNGNIAMKDSPATLLGVVAFRCAQTDIYPSTPERNSSFTYAGFMDIQSDVISSYFYVEGETYFMKYEFDPVTKKIISGPTKATYNRK